MGDIIVSIDIGTSKVCTVISKLDKDKNLTIIGKGIDFCSGVKKGVIVDIDSTATSIINSVQQAENAANVKIESAYVNIIGSQIDIINNRSITVFSKGSREITDKDIKEVFYKIHGIELPEDRQIIDIIPRQYIVDGCDEIIDPIGMVGSKLEFDADVIAGKITTVKNIIKSMEKVNLRVDGIIVEPLALSELILTNEEKNMGAVIIDVGGGTTNISVFEDSELIFCGTIPIGGDHITNDISLGLKIPLNEAEKLKREYEIALTSLIKNDQIITVSELNNEPKKKNIKISQITEIIEARITEILILAKNLLEKSGMLKDYSAGISLTGCGIAYADGVKELIRRSFNNVPVKIVQTKGDGILPPDYSVAFGICKFMAKQNKANKNIGSSVKVQEIQEIKVFNIFDKLISLVKNLF